jgi:hypothetical protein
MAGQFDYRERQLESGAYITQEEFWKFKKEFQEFKAVVKETEKLKNRLWTERLAFLGLLIASWGYIVYLLKP